jgi:hypothetical protein
VDHHDGASRDFVLSEMFEQGFDFVAVRDAMAASGDSINDQDHEK